SVVPLEWKTTCRSDGGKVVMAKSLNAAAGIPGMSCQDSADSGVTFLPRQNLRYTSFAANWKRNTSRASISKGSLDWSGRAGVELIRSRTRELKLWNARVELMRF